MIEEQVFKNYLIGLLLGGGSGFLLHKNLKISKGLGIGLGSVLGFVIAMQVMKEQRKKAIKLSEKTEALLTQDTTELEIKRKQAQSNLDMLLKISDDFNKNSKQEKRNGILYQVDNTGKDIGFWNGDNFTRTDGKDKLIQQYNKNIKDLGFTFLGRKVLTPAEYEIEKSKMF